MAKKGGFKKVLIGVLVLVLGIAGVAVVNLNKLNKEISKIEISNIDLNSVEDGVYIGEYNHSEAVGAKVEVTVKDNKIEKIEILEHNTGLGGKAEAIINSVIDRQSLEVDTISGATGSSTVILKAIEKAVLKN